MTLNFKKQRSTFALLIAGAVWGYMLPSQAATLGDFEGGSPFSGWSTAGDVSQQGSFQGIAPTSNTNQALLGTGRTDLQDDLPNAAGTFNYSGTNPVAARTGTGLESLLGLNIGALDLNSPFVQAVEGSAIWRTFTAQAGDTLSFDWSFLTNDGVANPFFGARDAAYVALYPVGSPSATLLASSTGVINSAGPNFATTTNGMFTSGSLAAGDYFLGLAVVDGQGTDTTSALLLDNLQLTPIPTPALLPGLIGFGMSVIKRKRK